MRVGHAPSRRDRRRRGGGRRCYERGLVYLNNRYHDPTLGSFVSVDPLVVQTGLAYSYTAGDPIGFSDPSGLDPCRLSGKCAGEYQDQAKILHYNGAVGSEEAARCSYRCAIDTPGDSWGPLYGDVMPSDVLYGSGDQDEMLLEGCGWKCAVSTTITGVSSFGLAAYVCAQTIGFGCVGAITVAGGTTGMVYESLVNDDVDKSDLACVFVFGPSDGVVSRLITGSSGLVGGAAKSMIEEGVSITREVASEFAQDQALNVVGDAVCD